MSVVTEDMLGLDLLVTGASGFLGSAFVREALARGARVTVIVRPTSNLWRLTAVEGSFTTWRGSFAELSHRGDTPVASTVVHFAASGVDQRFDDVQAMVETNIHGTLQMLEHAVRIGAGRFVHVGTSGEYGPGVAIHEGSPLRPTSEYGATRASATLVAQAFGLRRGLDVVVVRPFAVYGPFEASYRFVPHCILNALSGTPIDISSGMQTRDYVYVEDVAAGIALACIVPEASGAVVNLCTGIETAVLDAAGRVVELARSNSEILIGARPDIPGEMWRTSGSPQLAHNILGWQPRRTLEEGLGATVDWFRRIGVGLPGYRLGE